LSGIYLIGTGGGYVEVLGVLYIIILLGFTSVINYWLSEVIAHFAKRGRTLVRIAAWSILFPLLFCLLEAKRATGGGGEFFESFMVALRIYFLYDPAYSYPYILIPLGMWLLGVYMMTREDLKRVTQRILKTEV